MYLHSYAKSVSCIILYIHVHVVMQMYKYVTSKIYDIIMARGIKQFLCSADVQIHVSSATLYTYACIWKHQTVPCGVCVHVYTCIGQFLASYNVHVLGASLWEHACTCT